MLIKCAKLNLIKMSKNSKLNVLGVMTGTSMDGVDISLINTNGTDFVKIKCEKSYKFNKNYQNTINNLITVSYTHLTLPTTMWV